MSYRNPGDYELESCFVRLYDGTEKEIKGIASEINIYQDITSHYMTCSIVVDDAQGLIRQQTKDGYVGGINGIGAVVIRFKTSGKGFEFVTVTFGLYKITDRARIAEKHETYILHGISEEAYYTKSRKLSRAFGRGKGNTISNMIKGIHKEFLGTTKPIEVDDTKGLHRFVVPNWSVDNTIEFMRIEAVSNNRAPLFFFYENFNGYNFKDMNTLIKKDHVETYKYIPMNYLTTDYANEYGDATNIIGYAIKNNKDYLTKVGNGLFKSKTLNIDVLKKNTNITKFDYEKNFNSLNTISKLKYPSYEVVEDAYINMMTSRTGHDSDSILSAEQHVPKKINETKSFRNAYREMIFSQMITVDIPGDSNIQAGDMVHLEFPSATITEVSTEDRKADKYISGRYLVASVRHQMQKENYVTKLECVRDAGDII